MLGRAIIKRGRPSSAARGRRRGFTLVELIVAMSAGVLVGIAALLLAKNASRFFQHEARISAAQLAVTLGMNRLTADLQRASFLASPSHQGGKDPYLCQDGIVVPSVIKDWKGLEIAWQGSWNAHKTDLTQGASADNKLHPDSIVIGGSLATTEQFTIKDMPAPSGAAVEVKLQARNDEGMARLRAAALKNKLTLHDALQPIFVSGRFLRVIDRDDPRVSMYAIIRGATAVGPAPDEVVTVTLDPVLRFPDRKAGATCGVTALGNYRASVVYRVRYDIRSLQGDKNYKSLVNFDPNVAVLSGEDSRTELVRVELDENGAERPGTLELIAELAVDLKFSPTRSTSGFNPTMSTYPFDSPSVDTTGNGAVGTPAELVRAVSVRLATRTRVPDRDQPLSVGGPPYRFAVKPALPSGQQTVDAPPVYARMRYLHTTVSLPNQAGFTP